MPAYRESMAALGSHFLAAPQLEVWEHAGCDACLHPGPLAAALTLSLTPQRE